ncbi:MAG: hypothetical protein IPK69_04610 [Phycisphaerales bacterium]|nr:MAG: hypothetical protein IPK69_04610 [Phycisphaerales bacterium]
MTNIRQSLNLTAQGTIAALALGTLVTATHAQTIGPDLVNSSLNDVAMNGTSADGTITGYSCGNVTCNRGDMNLDTSPNTSVRPIVGMNMYRFVPGTLNAFQQLGQGWGKWVALPINGSHASCGGDCNGGGVGNMPPNCADLYSSGFNSPGGMCPRSQVNVTLGTLAGGRGSNTGEASISTRVQVPTSAVTTQLLGVVYFFETVDSLPADATYVRPGQTVAVNAMNNATSQQININPATKQATLVGGSGAGGAQLLPAIARWAELDDDVVLVTADHDDTPNPNASFPNTFIRSRYYLAGKATDLGGGSWHYEYNVYNLNSDRAADTLRIPFPSSATLSGVSFHHPRSHSGEPFTNEAWTAVRSGSELVFATEKFDTNPNANAIRWGTMYSFGFTTNVAPDQGSLTLELFKPGSTASIQASGMTVPGTPACLADVTDDGGVTIDDLLEYLDRFNAGTINADLDGDEGVTIDDLLLYLEHFSAGC